jgi:long-subunit fatty acid transport protein
MNKCHLQQINYNILTAKLFGLKLFLSLLIISCFLLMSYITEANGAGTSDNSMLKIGVGAKATSMGEASVAVTDDIASIYWNPAGLVQIKNAQLSAMHIEWFDDVRYEWLAFAQPLSKRVAIGVDVSYMYMGSISRTIESSTEGYEQDGTFSPVDMAGRVALSVKAFKNILLGASIQRIQSKVSFDKVTKEKISDKTAQGMAIDLGGIYNITRIQGLSVGGCLQNLGGQTKAYFTEKASMPFALNIGMAYKVQMLSEKAPTTETPNDKEPQTKTEPSSSPSALTIAADLSFPNDSSINARLGAEYRFGNGISLRGGYRTGRGSSFPSGLSAGIGYDSKDYQVDYAIVPYGDLGNTHRVSFTIRF